MRWLVCDFGDFGFCVWIALLLMRTEIWLVWVFGWISFLGVGWPCVFWFDFGLACFGYTLLLLVFSFWWVVGLGVVLSLMFGLV